MSNSIGIYKIYPESFRAKEYGTSPFRMIGLIDVGIMFNDGMERVTLGFYRSSGTNSGKIEGLWYPIVGLKLFSGPFNEFTPFMNIILSIATRDGVAKSGWLVKSLFFSKDYGEDKEPGYSKSKHNQNLYWIGKTLKKLYESGNYSWDDSLFPENYNRKLISNGTFIGNKRSQKDNFELFLEEIYYGES